MYYHSSSCTVITFFLHSSSIIFNKLPCLFIHSFSRASISIHSTGSLYGENGSAQQSSNCLEVVARLLQLHRKCVRLTQDNPKTVLSLLISRAILLRCSENIPATFLLRCSENIPATFSRMSCNNFENFRPRFDHSREIISRISWECLKTT